MKPLEDGQNELRANQVGYLGLCPGSYQMQLGMPEEKSAEATEGTAIHKACETGDTDGLSEDAAELVRRSQEASAEFFGDWKVEHEQLMRAAVPVPGEGDRLHPIRGTPDQIAMRGGKCKIRDDKTHRHGIPQDQVAIVQGCYALMAYVRNPKLQEVEIRVDLLRDGIHYATTYKDAQMDALRKRIGEIIHAGIYADEITLRPSKSACQYCLARKRCPAALRTLENLPATTDAYQLATPQRRSELLDKAKVAKRVIESLEKEAKAMLETDPAAIEGWEITERRGRRKIKDVNHVVNLLRGRLSPDQILSIMSLPPSALERLFCEGRENKADAKRELWQLIGEHVERGASYPVLQKVK